MQPMFHMKTAKYLGAGCMECHSCEVVPLQKPTMCTTFEAHTNGQWSLYLYSIVNNFEATSSIRVDETHRY